MVRMARGDEVQREAAAVLRRILDAVGRGELDAETPQARRLARRMEGATGALDPRDA